MRDDLHTCEASHSSGSNQVSRRHMLQLMGAGVAGIAGASVLASCLGLPDQKAPVEPTVDLTPRGTAPIAERPLSPYFMGYNNVPIHSPSWSDPNVLNVVKELNAANLRYPGGTVANYWNWQTGWFFSSAPGGFKNAMKTPIHLQDVQNVVQATNTQPIYVLNLLTSNLDIQMQLLHAAKNQGLPINLIELGNEFYLDQWPLDQNVFPSGREYGTKATEWIKAIHDQFPETKIAVVGTAPISGNGDPRKGAWNDQMFQTLKEADAITVHPYVNLPDGLISKGDPAGSMDRLNSTVAARWAQFQSLLQGIPGGMKIWVTEYNLASNEADKVFHTWMHGIIVASMTLSYLADKRVDLVSFYDMLGNTGNEAVYFDRRGKDQELPPYTVTAAGWTLRLLGETMQGMKSTEPLTINAAGGGTTVTGWYFTNGLQRRGFIVNASSSDVTWQGQTHFTSGQTHYQQLTASSPFKTIADTNDVKVKQGTLQGPLALPAYSVTQLK